MELFVLQPVHKDTMGKLQIINVLSAPQDVLHVQILD